MKADEAFGTVRAYRDVFGINPFSAQATWKQKLGSFLIRLGLSLGATNQTNLTIAGQKVLSHIIENGHVFKPTHVVGDPYLSAYNEGKRGLALMILNALFKGEERLLEQFKNK